VTQGTYLYDIATALYEKMKQGAEGFGLAAVFYGDQDLIPEYPACAIEPVFTQRELTGAGGRGFTDNLFEVYVFLYFGQVGDVQKSRQDTDAFSKEVQQYLNQDVTLGGAVIDGSVAVEESGQMRKGAQLQVTRLTWRGMTKTQRGA
jgi:hypothetical protein